MRQTGVIEKLDKKWNINFKVTGSQCVVTTSGRDKDLIAFGKEEVVSLLVLLISAITLSLAVLVFELWMRRIQWEK